MIRGNTVATRGRGNRESGFDIRGSEGSEVAELRRFWVRELIDSKARKLLTAKLTAKVSPTNAYVEGALAVDGVCDSRGARFSLACLPYFCLAR